MLSFLEVSQRASWHGLHSLTRARALRGAFVGDLLSRSALTTLSCMLEDVVVDAFDLPHAEYTPFPRAVLEEKHRRPMRVPSICL